MAHKVCNFVLRTIAAVWLLHPAGHQCPTSSVCPLSCAAPSGRLSDCNTFFAYWVLVWQLSTGGLFLLQNMYIKDAPEAGAKRMRTTGGYTGGGGGSSYSGGAGSRAPTGVYAPVSNTKDNPPCNTLFIGNLSDNVDEGELQGLFSTQPGFAQLKVVRNARNISCFVEYESVASAMQCHTTQQGAVLRSSDRGPIRIQYSKNPLGKKRDISGQMIDTTQRGAPVPPEEAAALTTAYSGM
eukprot:GHUV01017425.1.p1 GENE.GHUV01017425.1~~GHUV01017425.1.p1  ORF type:complete len:239 (+),score=59.96 GHUV01017425.1:155-871(+)